MREYIIEETIKENGDGTADAKYIFYDRVCGNKWKEDRMYNIPIEKLKKGKRVKKFGIPCIILP